MEKIPVFDFKGIKRITIPKRDSDFTVSNGYGWEAIKRFLPQILSAHKQNADKIDYLYNYWLGIQDIERKERTHEINKGNNNKEVENHAKRQVEFKVGFLCGEQRDYTHKSDTKSDDLIYLDRYFTDCKFFAKDADLKEMFYATGIGTTITRPRTDIIISDGVDAVTKAEKYRYKTSDEGFNIEFECPFEFDQVDPKENFVVYSSLPNKQPLFCVSYVDVDATTPADIVPVTKKELLIETRYAWFKFYADNALGTFYWNNDNDVVIQPKAMQYMPMIEFSANKDRMGIVETNRSAFNTINLFRSSVNDMIVDNANAILVFKNVDIESEEVKEMRKAGAIIISDSNNAKQGGIASLDTVTVEIPLDKMTVYLDQVMQNAYDIVGVPLASGSVTSGGDTGQARLLGGGWNNAYIIINKEIIHIKGIDYDQLKLFLQLCKAVPNCPLNELYASQIDINYRVNQNDNLLVKAQSMKYLYDMMLPEEFVLKVGGLSNDIKTDTANWQANIERRTKAEQKAEAQSQTDVEANAAEESDNKSSQEVII